MMMSWCLMSSDVSWHIRDKSVWPMPKHGSINPLRPRKPEGSLGRTAQSDVHLDSPHTAPELWLRFKFPFLWPEVRDRLRVCENQPAHQCRQSCSRGCELRSPSNLWPCRRYHPPPPQNCSQCPSSLQGRDKIKWSKPQSCSQCPSSLQGRDTIKWSKPQSCSQCPSSLQGRDTIKWSKPQSCNQYPSSLQGGNTIKWSRPQSCSQCPSRLKGGDTIKWSRL